MEGRALVREEDNHQIFVGELTACARDLRSVTSWAIHTMHLGKSYFIYTALDTGSFLLEIRG